MNLSTQPNQEVLVGNTGWCPGLPSSWILCALSCFLPVPRRPQRHQRGQRGIGSGLLISLFSGLLPLRAPLQERGVPAYLPKGPRALEEELPGESEREPLFWAELMSSPGSLLPQEPAPVLTTGLAVSVACTLPGPVQGALSISTLSPHNQPRKGLCREETETLALNTCPGSRGW